MATIFTEGFDKYGPICDTIAGANGNTKDVSELLTQKAWTTVGSGIATSVLTIVPGLSETGFAMAIVSQFGGFLSKTLAASYGRIIGGCRFQTDLQASSGVMFRDSLNAQVTITVDKLTGLITVFGGDETGTLLGQSQVSVSASTKHFINWDITFGTGALGSFQVWLDGVSVIAGTGTTQQIACNPSANVFQLVTGSAGAGLSSTFVYDDLHLFDSTGATNNAPLLANSRIETQFGILDDQTQFDNVGNIFGIAYSNQGPQGQQVAPGANTLILRQFSPNINCTIHDVGILPGESGTSITAKFKAVIYDDVAGVPDSLLSSGTEVIGSVANIPLVSALTSSQALTAGTPYWIGFIMDTSVQLSLENVTTVLGTKVANVYASGAPDPAPIMNFNQVSWVIWGQCTGAAQNWVSESVNPPPGDISAITSATPGTEDLYDFPALSADIVTVYAVAVMGHAKVVSAGTRTIDLRLKSGATDSAGSNPSQTPATSYGWMDTYFDVDPNGSIAWTPSTVNTATSGPKVAS